MKRRTWLGLCWLLLTACGSRSQLPGGEGASVDAGSFDSSVDATRPDAAVVDADLPDVLLDVALEAEIDVGPPPVGCPDGLPPSVFLFSETGTIYSFDPASRTFQALGMLDCETSASPNSMAVSRDGVAYVNYSDGSLFRVNLANQRCSRTRFDASQLAEPRIGMGFVADGFGGEELYVSVDQFGGGAELATIDTETFVLERVGVFNPPIRSTELTGTGDGRLFAFYLTSDVNGVTNGASIAPVNKFTAAVGEPVPVLQNVSISAWHFVFWGGDFYTLTAISGQSSSTISRYSPNDDSITTLFTLPERMVGAGASTCSPL